MHTHGVSLHHGRRSVDVNNKSGEEIPFAVHQAVGVVLRSVEVKHFAQAQGVGEAFAEELLIYLAPAEVKNPHGNGTALEVACADKSAVVSHNAHHVAFRWLRGQRAREHPGVKTVERFLFATFKF